MSSHVKFVCQIKFCIYFFHCSLVDLIHFSSKRFFCSWWIRSPLDFWLLFHLEMFVRMISRTLLSWTLCVRSAPMQLRHRRWCLETHSLKKGRLIWGTFHRFWVSGVSQVVKEYGPDCYFTQSAHEFVCYIHSVKPIVSHHRSDSLLGFSPGPPCCAQRCWLGSSGCVVGLLPCSTRIVVVGSRWFSFTLL